MSDVDSMKQSRAIVAAAAAAAGDGGGGQLLDVCLSVQDVSCVSEGEKPVKGLCKAIWLK